MATGTRNLPVEQKMNSIRTFLEKPNIKEQIKRALPKHLSPERLIRVALSAIHANPRLLDCTMESLYGAILECATLGLEPIPFLGQAYLVPFWNGRIKRYEVQFIPGYRGYISLARRSAEVQSVMAQVVYEKDQFELQYGLDEKLVHKPAERDRGAIKGAYAIFRYKDGSYSYDYMSKADIDKIKERTKSRNEKGEIVGPWITDEAEMAKKTVIRRHVKLAPVSVELARAAELDERVALGETQTDLTLPEIEDKAIDVTPTKTFEDLVKEKFGEWPAQFDAFLEDTAKKQKSPISVEELKAQALEDFDTLGRFFLAWKEKQPKPAPQTEGEPTEDEAREEMEKAGMVPGQKDLNLGGKRC